MKTGHLTDRQQQDSVFASEVRDPAAVQAHLAQSPTLSTARSAVPAFSAGDKPAGSGSTGLQPGR